MPPLQIVVSVINPASLSMGEIRLLDFLLSDPRYHVSALLECTSTYRMPVLARLIAALESPFSTPKSNFPAVAWKAAKDRLPVLHPGQKPAADSNTDVLIDFTGSDAVFKLFPHPKYGVWRLSAYRSFAGFSAARMGQAATRVDLSLQMAPGDPLKRIASALYGTKFLAGRNTTFIREKSVQLIERELARLARGRRTGNTGQPTETAAAAPHMADALAYWVRVMREFGRRGRNVLWQKLGQRPGAFQIRIGHGDPLNFDPASAVPVPLPRNGFQADPFFFRKEDKLFLFVEEFDYARGLGHISVGCVTGAQDDTAVKMIGVALKTDYHLSYPFVFQHKDNILMMPETHQTGRLEIWRATNFPLEWTLKSTALEGQSPADSVLLQHRGEWWLFTNICRDSFGDMCSELHLFRVDGPDLTRLEPHPLNPVVIDSTTARGGGRVFQHGDRLFRASQNNSAGTYGYGLNIMEITRLDMREYSENPVRRITPDFAPGLIGCHHADFDGSRFVIDVRKSKV